MRTKNTVYTATVLNERGELDEIRSEMSELFDLCPQALVYGSVEWLFAWLDTLGRNNQWHMLTIRAEGKLVAYWGFFECPAIGKKGLWPWGVHSGDEFSPVVHPNYGEAQFELLDQLEEMLEDYAFSWLPLCRPDFLGRLKDYLSSRKKIGIYEKLWSDDPVISLRANSFEEYLKDQFSAKTRQSFRRYERKLQADGVLEWARYEQPDGMSFIYEKMESIERTSWKGNQSLGLFNRLEVREFYKKVLPELANRGWVSISALKLNGRFLAYEFGFVCGNSYGMHNIAFRPEAGIYSPGKLLMLKNIEYAFSRKLKTYDFLQGDEIYKKEFANDSLPLIDLTIYPRNFLGYLNQWAVRFASFTKKREER